MNNNAKLWKESILRRPSLRGLKKCPCGFLNGQRSLICRNVACELRQKALESIKPFDPIQLITYNKTQLYSLRCKEKLISLRNFVIIAEQSLDLKLPCSAIVPYAVCYIDKCKYGGNDSSQPDCKHVNACSSLNGKSNKAEVYRVDKSILWNLNINEDKKILLWQLYQSEEKSIPAVQRVNSNMFAVKCTPSDVFPAGRLHTTVFTDNVVNKKGTFLCACRKLKIVVEADNTITMKNEICDHLLLLLAAILSHTSHKTLFTAFLDTLQTLWMPVVANVPSSNVVNRDFGSADILHQTPISSGKNLISDSHEDADIFNYTEDMFTESVIPDFVDIAWDVESAKQIPSESNKFLVEFKPSNFYMKDPKLISTSATASDEDMDLLPTFSYVKSPVQLTPTTNMTNNLPSPVQMLQHNDPLTDKICLLTESNLRPAVVDNKQIPPLSLKPFDSTPISKAFVKQTGIPTKKSTDTTCNGTAVNQQIAGILSIDPLKQFMLHSKQRVKESTEEVKIMDTTTNAEPSLSYIGWLEHIIEMLNDSIAVKESNNVRHSFHVHELKLQTERTYELLSDGSLAPFKPHILDMPITKGRLICPKVKLYNVFINFSTTTSKHFSANNQTSQRAGVKIEWLPIYPKSHFGLMAVDFCVCVQES
uniref:Zf-tcix domain-containing protein n=1 Tax=Glossina austeni TaxID=7395 RepID=A0A1A9UVH1_GLOAU